MQKTSTITTLIYSQNQATSCVSGSSQGYPDGVDGFYTNAGGGDSESSVEQALFHATGESIDLELYGKSDDNPSLFSFNPSDPEDSQSGTFSVLDQTLIYYITVKGANSFALYELASPNATGVYSTLGLLTPNGNSQPDVSHISFWTRPFRSRHRGSRAYQRLAPWCRLTCGTIPT